MSAQPGAPPLPLAARLHTKIQKSMVRFNVMPTSEQPDAFNPVTIRGVILALETKFAYVVADPRFFYQIKYPFRLKFHFPGHEPVLYDAPVTHLNDNIIGICCPYLQGYDMTQIEEIQVSEPRPSPRGPCLHSYITINNLGICNITL